MTSLNPSLRLALLQKAKGKKNIFEKGFTLVELMTVIVIVGVLSAVALPSFLNQSAKAKGTEATAQITSIMKDAAAIYQQDPNSGISSILATDSDCTEFGAPAALTSDNGVKTLFDYGCSYTGTTLTVNATANANDTQIEGNEINMSVDLSDGSVERNTAATSKLFGGSKANYTPG